MSNRKKQLSIARTLALMPDRTNSFLALAAGAIFTLYIFLVILTVVFATMQTTLAVDVRDTEGSISALETNYYAAIAKGNGTTPAQVGMVAPAEVEYATAKPASGLSFAGK